MTLQLFLQLHFYSWTWGITNLFLQKTKDHMFLLKGLMMKSLFFRILLYLRAEGFEMYQPTENQSRNLSVMSLNANRWREVVCVKGYWMCIMAFLPTWNATAVTECRNAETWKCCCPRLEKTREMSVVMFLMFEVALGLNIGHPLLSFYFVLYSQ